MHFLCVPCGTSNNYFTRISIIITMFFVPFKWSLWSLRFQHCVLFCLFLKLTVIRFILYFYNVIHNSVNFLKTYIIYLLKKAACHYHAFSLSIRVCESYCFCPEKTMFYYFSSLSYKNLCPFKAVKRVILINIFVRVKSM